MPVWSEKFKFMTVVIREAGCNIEIWIRRPGGSAEETSQGQKTTSFKVENTFGFEDFSDVGYLVGEFEMNVCLAPAVITRGLVGREHGCPVLARKPWSVTRTLLGGLRNISVGCPVRTCRRPPTREDD